jgi:GH24 family phage-related lysozyme (muramidase)
MARFTKTGDPRGYDPTLGKQLLEPKMTAQILLGDGGADIDAMTVASSDEGVFVLSELAVYGGDVRGFVLTGVANGKATLDARDGGGFAASMDVEVVDSVPIVAPAPVAPNKPTAVTVPGAPMKTSKEGKAWMIGNEGARHDHYNDSNDHCTVGVGHLVHKGKCTPAELALPDISDAEIAALFERDLPPREKFVNDQKFTLTQTEFDAIVDLTFQSWPFGDFGKKVKAGDKAGAAAILGSETTYPGRGERRKILYLEGRYVDRGGK